MWKEKGIRCDYLMKNDRSCLKVVAGETEKNRKKFCSNKSIDLCCDLCDSRKECQINCTEMEQLEAEKHAEAEGERLRLKEEEDRRVAAVREDIEKFVRAGRYEDAALLYEQLNEWDKAGDIRRMTRTSYLIAADVHLGEDGISIKCPHCSSAERLESKTNEATCSHCGKKYFVPKKILDMI